MRKGEKIETRLINVITIIEVLIKRKIERPVYMFKIKPGLFTCR